MPPDADTFETGAFPAPAATLQEARSGAPGGTGVPPETGAFPAHAATMTTNDDISALSGGVFQAESIGYIDGGGRK